MSSVRRVLAETAKIGHNGLESKIATVAQLAEQRFCNLKVTHPTGSKTAIPNCIFPAIFPNGSRARSLPTTVFALLRFFVGIAHAPTELRPVLFREPQVSAIVVGKLGLGVEVLRDDRVKIVEQLRHHIR